MKGAQAKSVSAEGLLNPLLKIAAAVIVGVEMHEKVAHKDAWLERNLARQIVDQGLEKLVMVAHVMGHA